MEQDQAFLEYVVKALVDNPDDVVVERVVDEMGVLLTLTVHKDDMGKIIGRSGNTAKAVRILLRVVGMKNDARVNLKINEPEGGTGGRFGHGNREYDDRDNRDNRDDSRRVEREREVPQEDKKAISQSVDDVMAGLDL